MKKVALIPVAAILLISGIVACNKTAPPAPVGPNPAVGHPSAYMVPTFLGCDMGRGRNCFASNSSCLIYLPDASVTFGSGIHAAVDGDITSSGHLLMTVHLSGLDADVMSDLLSTGKFEPESDLTIPQTALDDLCDAQSPAVSHWSGPVKIPAGSYSVSITNSGADEILEIEGTCSSTGTWSWAFRLH